MSKIKKKMQFIRIMDIRIKFKKQIDFNIKKQIDFNIIIPTFEKFKIKIRQPKKNKCGNIKMILPRYSKKKNNFFYYLHTATKGSVNSFFNEKINIKYWKLMKLEPCKEEVMYTRCRFCKKFVCYYCQNDLKKYTFDDIWINIINNNMENMDEFQIICDYCFYNIEYWRNLINKFEKEKKGDDNLKRKRE
jgi:hypothetical protein